MPSYDFRLFSNCNTKISEKSDMAKSWAARLCRLPKQELFVAQELINKVKSKCCGIKVYIVGINKICQDLDAAVKRARSTAAPVNAQRFNLNTPCKADGVCHNCQSPDSICNYIWIQRLSPNHRHTVILVAEDLGY